VDRSTEAVDTRRHRKPRMTSKLPMSGFHRGPRPLPENLYYGAGGARPDGEQRRDDGPRDPPSRLDRLSRITDPRCGGGDAPLAVGDLFGRPSTIDAGVRARN